MLEAFDTWFPLALVTGAALIAWSLRKHNYHTTDSLEEWRKRAESETVDYPGGERGTNAVYVNGTEVWRGEGPINLSTNMNVDVDGDCASVASRGNVRCAAVHGDVNAGGNVTCPSVTGDVSAGGNATVGQVGGDVSAGGNVKLLERKR